MRSGVMRISVSPLRPWRMISWPAACGMRWVKPSSATVSPSRTADVIASAREEIHAIRNFPVGVPYLRPPIDRVKWLSRHKLELQRIGMLGKEPIFTIHAELEAITSLGQTPYGERRVIGILGGTVRGPRLAGRILPGGQDWQIIRSD